MPLDDLPDWLPAWCVDQLGDEPVSVLFELRQISAVFGLRLAGGRDVVVKARQDDGRAVSCVAAQARLAQRGFPCARPLTPVVGVGSLAVHAEEFRPGGEVVHGDPPEVTVRSAACWTSWPRRLAGGGSRALVVPGEPGVGRDRGGLAERPGQTRVPARYRPGCFPGATGRPGCDCRRTGSREEHPVGTDQ
jgi:hypothetical protein